MGSSVFSEKRVSGSSLRLPSFASETGAEEKSGSFSTSVSFKPETEVFGRSVSSFNIVGSSSDSS